MTPRIDELRVKADLANLGVVAEFISTCCKNCQVDEENTYRIQLAVDEAITNVIQHAYGDEEGDVLIRCWEDRHSFCVQLHDWGRSFSPDDVSNPDIAGPLEEREVGGLGIHMMQKLMDEVRFEFGDNGNLLFMVKHDVVP